MVLGTIVFNGDPKMLVAAGVFAALVGICFWAHKKGGDGTGSNSGSNTGSTTNSNNNNTTT